MNLVFSLHERDSGVVESGEGCGGNKPCVIEGVGNEVCGKGERWERTVVY